MKNGFKSEHWNDPSGNPAGGSSFGTGFSISWQNGPLGMGKERKNPNGAFVEDVIGAVVNRIEYYQSSKFNCDDNRDAIVYLNVALDALNKRTKNRKKRKVEGTHAE